MTSPPQAAQYQKSAELLEKVPQMQESISLHWVKRKEKKKIEMMKYFKEFEEESIKNFKECEGETNR